MQVSVFTSSGTQAQQSTDIRGTQPWTELSLTWKAPKEPGLGSVCARRKMSDMPGSDIQGAAWIDDVSLTPARATPPGESPKP